MMSLPRPCHWPPLITADFRYRSSGPMHLFASLARFRRLRGSRVRLDHGKSAGGPWRPTGSKTIYPRREPA
jgi:hypothetical protein